MTALAPKDGLSHVVGPKDAPLIDLTIPALLAQAVDRFPHSEAAIFSAQGIRKTYAAFAQDVDALATGMLSLDLPPGARVGICARLALQSYRGLSGYPDAGVRLGNRDLRPGVRS